MGECDAPPLRGDYVEVRCGAYVIVGRVAWSGADRFGACAQHLIALPDLLASAHECAPVGAERCPLPRAEHVAPGRGSLIERAAASARFVRTLDFAAAALAGAALASLAAGWAHDALARPIDQVNQPMAMEQER